MGAIHPCMLECGGHPIIMLALLQPPRRHQLEVRRLDCWTVSGTGTGTGTANALTLHRTRDLILSCSHIQSVNQVIKC
jgi:hypothetical protein